MQMAHPALNAVVALLCCAPGMHTLSRQCCSALCQACIAQPLIGLLSAEPDGPRCTEVGFLRCNSRCGHLLCRTHGCLSPQ